MPKLLAILCFAALALIGGPTAAQSSNPLLDMLAYVPDDPTYTAASPVVGYVDYAAAYSARPGVPHYASWADWDARSRDEPSGVWIANIGRIRTGPEILSSFLQFEQMPVQVGFDFFDLDRVLMFGQPPGYGLVVAGDFDAAGIIAAYTQRDYAKTMTQSGVTVLRRADGKPGFTIDIRGRDPANPFGGELGRKEPLAIAGDYLLDSPDDATLDLMVASFDSGRTLADRAEYAAMAEALTAGDGLLVQAILLDPATISAAPEIVRENVAAKISAAMADYQPLPSYALAALADISEDGDDLAVIALAYLDETDAQAATEALATRIASFPNILADDDRPMLDAIPGAVVDAPRVYAADNGLFVAVVTVRAPISPNTRVDEDGNPDSNGRLALSARGFTTLATAFYRNELFPLWLGGGIGGRGRS